MAESLSSVPPVWPRPRPEIIGTKAPQAATIGASIRLTLSPTPPLECLSSTGPGRSRSRQSSMMPERARPSVSATRSGTVMPRKNTVMREGRHLALDQAAVMDATHDEGDLLVGEFVSVALPANDLLRQHVQAHRSRKVRSTRRTLSAAAVATESVCSWASAPGTRPAA